MSVPKSYFTDFLSEIRPTTAHIGEMKTGHTTLRKRLNADEDLKGLLVADFLQGSYRRATAIRPKNGKRSDVDIIVVTNLDKDKCTPYEALKKFEPFVEKHYSGKWRRQGRSIGIELSYVDLDLVVTAAPSETQKDLLKDAARTWAGLALLEDLSVSDWESRLLESRDKTQWKLDPLWIPDRDAGKWEETDPLEQIRWTQEKNAACNGHYVNVVKTLKWWVRVNAPDTKPKGYPLEHMTGDNCPDGVSSVEEGLVLTLEAIITNYWSDYSQGIKPILADRGVPSHDVLAGTTVEEFRSFYERVQLAAKIAREAFDEQEINKSSQKWREILGDKFPLASTRSQGFTQRSEISTPRPGRFS